MKHSLEYLQLEVGWDEPILLVDYTKLHKFYANKCSVWQNLHHCQIQLHLPTKYHLSSPMLNNKAITKVIIAMRIFDDNHLIHMKL